MIITDLKERRRIALSIKYHSDVVRRKLHELNASYEYNTCDFLNSLAHPAISKSLKDSEELVNLELNRLRGLLYNKETLALFGCGLAEELEKLDARL
jgi:hypothetical protein